DRRSAAPTSLGLQVGAGLALGPASPRRDGGPGQPGHTKAAPGPRTCGAGSAARAQSGRHGPRGPAPAAPRAGQRGCCGPERQGSGRGPARGERSTGGRRVAVRSGPSPPQEENNTTATWPRRGACREEGRAGREEGARAGAQGRGSPGSPQCSAVREEGRRAAAASAGPQTPELEVRARAAAGRKRTPLLS
ncbi:Hypothetical predicted protein, partial [Marmota monax]